MKLKLKQNDKLIHQDIISSVSWAPNNQLFSLSDDKTILVWDSNGEYISKFLDIDVFCTALEWGPNLKSANDALCLGTSNGALRILNKTGKVEKVVEDAHTTAVGFINLDHLYQMEQ
jgi:WD40 repeat protein